MSIGACLSVASVTQHEYNRNDNSKGNTRELVKRVDCTLNSFGAIFMLPISTLPGWPHR